MLVRPLLSTLCLSVSVGPAYASIDGYHETIEMSDGVKLDAYVVKPDGEGPHPILIAPTSWTAPLLQWKFGAEKYANKGYAVVTYTPRGWFKSKGEIDVAGPDTVEDVSEMIDWAIDNLDGDEDRVGAYGISYGAGISLLAASNDSRILAVGAMSTWTNLERSLVPNDTPSVSAIDILSSSADVNNPSEDMEDALDDILAGDFEYPREFAADRSPAFVIDDLNKNGTAVFIANSWDDGIFGPSPLIDYYQKLEGPKRMIIQPGDHGVEYLTEYFGLKWDPDYLPVIGDVGDWMDVYVKGSKTRTDTGIELVSNDKDARVYKTDDWDALATDRTFYLTEPKWYSGYTGGFSSSSSDWSRSIWGGFDTIARSGMIYLHSILGIYNDDVLGVATGFVNRSNAMVWQSGPLYNTDIVGITTLEVTVKSTKRDTQLVAYLYEKPRVGLAKLISHQPYTVRDLDPGKRETVSIDFEATAWDLESGSRLFVVVDTKDGRYGSGTKRWTKVEFSSRGTGAKLTVPFRTKSHGKGDGESVDDRRSFNGDFAWSSTGSISGMDCTRIYEGREKSYWRDNYFCSSKDIGAKWSSRNAISGMDCTRIVESADPNSWHDNYFCVPKDSKYDFSWSSAGPVSGEECVQWIEDADPHTWADNYLCWTEDDDAEGVTVFKSSDYRGTSEVLSYGKYDTSDLLHGKNEIGSIRVPPGYRVVLYDASGFESHRYVVNDDMANLGHFDDDVDSIEITTPR